MNISSMMTTEKFSQYHIKLIQISVIVIIFILIFNLNLNSPNNTNLLENDYKPQNQHLTVAIESTRSNFRSTYTYHNYTTLVSDLKQLNTTYPDLIELFTAQDRYGLSDCKDGYKIWVARITNEKLGFDKPEVLFIGGHHGDEPISVDAPYYLIEFLVQNYDSDPFIRYLVDHREIYVMPVVNPYGWEHDNRYDGNDQDVNRDYPYGKSGVQPHSDGIPISTVGARSVAEFMKDHLFILSLSWHSGQHLIYYAWGSPVHNTPPYESPDNMAYFGVAKQMSNFAGGDDKYLFEPANNQLPAAGAWSDYAYAATWDTEYLTSGFETPGARSLALGIEISETKKPNQNTLGGSDEVLNPEPGSNIGYISQNIRMAIVLIDLAEPYLTWIDSNSDPIPKEVEINSNITLSWFVNGSFSVTETNLRFGTDPNPINNFEYITEDLTGDSHWDGNYFSQEITLPDEPGDYYFVSHAIVDQESLIQNNPEPNILPQSFFVNQRTNASWNISNNGNTITGRNDWYSPIINIRVLANVKNRIQITNYSSNAYCNEQFNITWEVITNDTINHTELNWGQNNDLINQSEHVTMPTDVINGSSGYTIKYYANFSLPAKPGDYYFAALMNVITESLNSSKTTRDYWSQIIHIEVVPQTPYQLYVSLPTIEYINGFEQTLTLMDITCKNLSISNEPLNDSKMISHRGIIIGFNPDSKNVTIEPELIYELKWSMARNSWYLPMLNVSTWDTGWYMVSCRFEHKYGAGQSNNEINLELDNWFKLEHIIVVRQPIVQLISNQTTLLNILNISNVTARCSDSKLGNLDDSEVLDYCFEIYNLSTNKPVFNGTLKWSLTNQSWNANNINLSNLSSGDYFVICRFRVSNIGGGESTHITGDKTEFRIPRSPYDSSMENDKEKNPNSLDNYFILIIVVLILVIILILMILILRTRKKY